MVQYLHFRILKFSLTTGMVWLPKNLIQLVNILLVCSQNLIQYPSILFSGYDMFIQEFTQHWFNMHHPLNLHPFNQSYDFVNVNTRNGTRMSFFACSQRIFMETCRSVARQRFDAAKWDGSHGYWNIPPWLLIRIWLFIMAIYWNMAID